MLHGRLGRSVWLIRSVKQYDGALLKTAKVLGIYVPKKGTHALRRSYISTNCDAGGDRDKVERITHIAGGDILDGCTTYSWGGEGGGLCEAAAAFDLNLDGDDVIALPQAVGAGLCPRVCPTTPTAS